MSTHSSNGGFTLIELLIVMLVIGILAAIALPTFAGQVKKGYDASAESNVAALGSLMEQCAVETEDFRSCDTQAELAGGPADSTGIPIGNAVEQVEIVQANRNLYRLRGRSRSGVSYRLFRNGSGRQQRTCDPANRGDCPSGGTW